MTDCPGIIAATLIDWTQCVLETATFYVWMGVEINVFEINITGIKSRNSNKKNRQKIIKE